MTKAYTVADWHQANVNIATDAATQRFDSNATKVGFVLKFSDIFYFVKISSLFLILLTT